MISILMGLHRVDDYLFPAIDSILTQENIDLELIVVANGKYSKNILEVIRNFYPNEQRIRLFETPIGQLAHALNIALSHAKYNYVARMDADDISHPHRLKTQLDYLISNDYDLIGSSAHLIDKDGKNIGIITPPQKNKITKLLPYRNCFIHPTIIAKKDLLINIGGYNSGFNSEDYDIWLRLRRNNIKWDNINSPLLYYRIHGAASQRRLLGYAEVSGLMMREFLLTKDINFFFSAWLTIIKSFFRSR